MTITRNITVYHVTKIEPNKFKVTRVENPRVIKSMGTVFQTVNYGTVTWGIIQGTLSDQIDLNNRLLQMNGGTF